ncbi:galactosyltransferase-related protein [Herbiconiux sp. KACC 21604]|uniref:glycosyltransferase family 2 protein n=1 Tax=unclassified Herbiconiux TaxID=2618217 RepID=UPI001491F5FD|nr:galactosyltransferase-related protein [Herbiconiux sp. SALV-R1]QJU54644.1 glycosyltransferase family 2 protein [Herbiconiux sp. SALV-R1]WPO85743.1 galactosyltransferase-related protein [Herbiconiux sp. KACC 21604]
MTRTAVITVVRGRHDHLTLQREALARPGAHPLLHVVVAMGDPGLEALPALDHPDVVVRHVPAGRTLPLARARNVGAATAALHGASTFVFLDVDCVPAPGAVEAYAAAAEHPATADRLLCGPVTYLPAPGPGGYRLDELPALDSPHAARPAPAPGEVQLGGPHELFWSLSFALTHEVWQRLGGFHEGYSGYGGEDTDVAFTARMRGVELAWIGSARAYHQHHPVQSPPVEHLDDILRNARTFHERWGSWPMQGWLDQFERAGLVQRDADGYRRRPVVSDAA